MIVKPGTNFSFEVGLEFSGYELLDVEINISQKQEILNFTSPVTVERDRLTEETAFNFSAAAAANGICNLIVKIEYVIFFEHTTEEDSDYREETILERAIIIVGSLSLAPLVWALEMANGRSGFTLLANSDVSNVTIHSPENVVTTPSSHPHLFTGEMAYFGLTADFNGEDEEDINDPLIISWEEDGSSYVAAIKVMYNPPSEEETNYVPLVGRAVGFISFIILVISTLTGGTISGIKSFLNRKLGARRRRNVHCAISWLLLGLALYHGMILVTGVYYQVAWNILIVLGWLAIISMIVASLAGLFMTWFIKRMGRRNWRILNIGSSVIPIMLVVVHMVLIGTDFEFVRVWL
jgi:hypothetical protein